MTIQVELEKAMTEQVAKLTEKVDLLAELLEKARTERAETLAALLAMGQTQPEP